MANRRGGLWLGLTGLGLLLYVIAEVAALIWVAGEIGWWTLLILLTTTVLGLFLLQREWRKTWKALSESLRSGQLPQGQMADASLVLTGGILLILPGLLSDVVGALLLLPFTRPFVKSAISWWAARTLQRSGNAPVVIKGETVAEAVTLIPEIAPDLGFAPREQDESVVIEGTIIDPEGQDSPRP
ncbi:hypothetical protein BW730_05450 [Tessaracoccus aquimaris]|uniref:FxsA protein n=1 Tax=Tessaracoccus aquimaris TaxID=1332264 RepID=A0A1Q2CLU3_9ACTN|nr:FxsA family protein [Tessaracoccus aquimaris]AQP47045.1 hypothetical protein BW730_05450 [Tessaracoccus aquimaris]